MINAPLFNYGAATLLGVASHIAYFNRSEHHLHATRYMRLLLLLTYSVGVFLLTRLNDQRLPSALSSVALLTTSYLTGLYASLLTNRAFLHPLNHFPGPFAARLSDFWLTLYGRRSRAYKTIGLPWGGTFNDKAVRGYEMQARRFSTSLVRQLGAFGGGAVDVSAWLSCYAYDVNGRFGVWEDS